MHWRRRSGNETGVHLGLMLCNNTIQWSKCIIECAHQSDLYAYSNHITVPKNCICDKFPGTSCGLVPLSHDNRPSFLESGFITMISLSDPSNHECSQSQYRAKQYKIEFVRSPVDKNSSHGVYYPTHQFCITAINLGLIQPLRIGLLQLQCSYSCYCYSGCEILHNVMQKLCSMINWCKGRGCSSSSRFPYIPH